eukprot:386359-Pleurochrysis_carterae.AAC.1
MVCPFAAAADVTGCCAGDERGEASPAAGSGRARAAIYVISLGTGRWQSEILGNTEVAKRWQRGTFRDGEVAKYCFGRKAGFKVEVWESAASSACDAAPFAI